MTSQMPFTSGHGPILISPLLFHNVRSFFPAPATPSNPTCLMTAFRNCPGRQDLLETLTLAVEAVHPAAASSIVDYMATPLTDNELSDLVQSLRPGADCDDWSQDMTRSAQACLLGRINHAKTRYATFLRASNQHDIELKWPYSHSLQSLGMLHSKHLATFFEGLWSRRYTHRADGNLGPQSFRSFSVVVSSSELVRLCEFVRDWRIDVKENILQTFGPLEAGVTTRTMQEIHLQMVQALHNIHMHRFETATPTVERGNEPWFPFPNVVRQSNELVAPPRIEHMMGRKLDSFKDWDCGKAGDVVSKHATPSRTRNHRAAARRITHGPQRGTLPSHWKRSEPERRDDFFAGKLGDKSARGPVRWPDLPVIKEDRQYNKAARPQPPHEYQMEALSNSGDDAGSVAVASLSTVAGDLQRMKSFVRKPSRGEALQPSPTAQEVEVAQAEALPTPPSPGRAIPMSGRPPSNTGLATPPDSASPVKPQGPTKRLNRRAPSAASKAKARRPQVRRPVSSKVETCSTTSSSSRTGSNSSMETFTKTSENSSSTTAESSSPTNIWSHPLEKLEVPKRRRSSGLGAFSPTKQATTSVQHIEVAAQRQISESGVACCSQGPDNAIDKQLDDIPVQRLRKERIDSAITPIHCSAIEALRGHMSPRDTAVID